MSLSAWTEADDHIETEEVTTEIFMSERVIDEARALAVQLAYWAAYAEGVADTTNEDYDHVLKKLSSTYQLAADAIRNDQDKDLELAVAQFETLKPAVDVFRGYDEGEQETRIFRGFHVMKSDVEDYLEIRRRALKTQVRVDAQDIADAVSILNQEQLSPLQSFQIVTFRQTEPDTIDIYASGEELDYSSWLGSAEGYIDIDGKRAEVGEDIFMDATSVHFVGTVIQEDLEAGRPLCAVKLSASGTDGRFRLDYDFGNPIVEDPEPVNQETPTVSSPPSSFSPAAPSGGGIKRPSGLKAPGERKSSVGGRSL